MTTAYQPVLFSPLPIEQQFEDFHRAHPEVYAMILRLAYELKASGHTSYSMDALLHRVRWHHHVERGDATFKLNNNFTSRYARLAAKEPGLEEFFGLRRLRA